MLITMFIRLQLSQKPFANVSLNLLELKGLVGLITLSFVFFFS